MCSRKRRHQDYASNEIFVSLGTLKDTCVAEGQALLPKEPNEYNCILVLLCQKEKTVTKDCRRNIWSKLNLQDVLELQFKNDRSHEHAHLALEDLLEQLQFKNDNCSLC
jgi:hypothetical protein